MFYSSNKARRRKGFTLIELIVVLFILVGLAALIVPTVTDMVGRTRTSTSASSISEVAHAIQRYEVQYLTTPDNYDSLVTSLTTGAALTKLDQKLIDATETVTLTTAKRAPLTAAGINNVGVHGANNTTYSRAVITALADDDKIRALTATAQENLGLEASGAGVAGKYIVLGVGTLTDMKGRTMMEPPVAFPGEGPVNPTTSYRRYIAVYKITDSASNPLLRAKLVAVLAPDASNIATELSDYFIYSLVKD